MSFHFSSHEKLKEFGKKHKKSGKTEGIFQWPRRERFSPVWCMCHVSGLCTLTDWLWREYFSWNFGTFSGKYQGKLREFYFHKVLGTLRDKIRGNFPLSSVVRVDQGSLWRGRSLPVFHRAGWVRALSLIVKSWLGVPKAGVHYKKYNRYHANNRWGPLPP